MATLATLPPSYVESFLRYEEAAVSASSSLDEHVPLEKVIEHCHVVYVTVKGGRNISGATFIPPDPYIKLRVTTPNLLTYTTSVRSKTWHPEWNEKFKFLLDKDRSSALLLELWDAMTFTADKLVEKQQYNLDEVRVGETKSLIMSFGQNSRVEVEIERQESKTIDLRQSPTLHDDEKSFLSNRKKKVLEAMRKVYKEKAPTDVSEVPVIGVLGSGGGFRAMIGFSGVISMLEESGLLDMVTYVAGVSGSTWLLGYLYSLPNWPGTPVAKQCAQLQERITKSLWEDISNSEALNQFFTDMENKEKNCQRKNLTDFFGNVVGRLVLKEQMYSCLSDQGKKTKDGSVPMPIYNSIRVKDDVSASEFNDWVEYTPFEICLPKYDISLHPRHFDSHFYKGQVLRAFPETQIHYLFGIWGSAYSAIVSDLKQQKKKKEDSESSNVEESGGPSTTSQESCESDEKKDGILSLLEKLVFHRNGRIAAVLNFLHGLKLARSQDLPNPSAEEDNDGDDDQGIDPELPNRRYLLLADAGISLNLPMPPLLRPQRNVDLLLSFDFSARDSDDEFPFKELLKAEEWSRERKIPFPPITVTEESVAKEGIKECYVFRDPNDDLCPIVVHFVLINESFRKDNKPYPEIKDDDPDDDPFRDFSIFDGSDYSTMKFSYSHRAFWRLNYLMAHNTLHNRAIIDNAIIECITRRRERPEA